MKNLNKLEDFLNSPEGIKATQDFISAQKRRIKNIENNVERVSRILANKTPEERNSFIEKLFISNGREYREKCLYKKGIEPVPTPLLSAFFELMKEKGEKLKPREDSHFNNERFSYLGFILEIYYGQGLAWKVFSESNPQSPIFEM